MFLQLYQENVKDVKECKATLHLVESSPSVLREMPWIMKQEHKVCVPPNTGLCAYLGTQTVTLYIYLKSDRLGAMCQQHYQDMLMQYSSQAFPLQHLGTLFRFILLVFQLYHIMAIFLEPLKYNSIVHVGPTFKVLRSPRYSHLQIPC